MGCLATDGGRTANECGQGNRTEGEGRTRRRAIKHEPSKISHGISKQAQKHCQTRNRHRKQTARGILIRKEEAQIIFPTQPSRAHTVPIPTQISHPSLAQDTIMSRQQLIPPNPPPKVLPKSSQNPLRARPKPTASRTGEPAPHGRVRIQHEVQVPRVVLGVAVATDFGTIQQNQSTKYIEGQARGGAKTLTNPQTPKSWAHTWQLGHTACTFRNAWSRASAGGRSRGTLSDQR